MRRGLPITLWRHVLAEQIRLVLVSLGVVVVVIVFSAAIKPIADGNLDPLDAPKFMLLAVVPMLAYTLPFAGGFGTTLAFHRIAQDNETLAAHAGGISHRSVLMPAAMSGLMLSLALLALNEQVIPRFLRSMEELVTRNLALVVVRSVEQGRAVEFGDAVIYAEAAQALGADPVSGAYERIAMRGVVFLELGEPTADDTISIKAELFTSNATIWLFHGSDLDDPKLGDGTVAVIRLDDSVLRREGDRTMVRVEDRIEIGPTFLPGAFSNDPKFLTFGELRELPTHPERMEFIAWRKRELAFRLGEAQTIDAIRDSLRDSGRVRLEAPGGQIRIEGSDLVPSQGAWRVVEGAGGVIEVLKIIEGGGLVKRWQVEQAILRADLGRTREERRLEFDLETLRARVIGNQGVGGQGEREKLPFGSLTYAGVSPDELADQSTDDLLEDAAAQIGSMGERRGRPLVAARDDLVGRIARLKREILSKQHERLAMSVSCFVMVMTGAIVALRLRHASSLTVYLWSFFPALAALVTINGGQQLVHRLGEGGLPLLWGGNAALALYAFVAYRGLARH